MELRIFALLLLVASGMASAESFHHVFAETMDIEGVHLVLNGKGVRKATLLGVRVYEGGLYVKEKSTSADTILSSTEPKVLELMYLRDLSKRDAGKAWDAAFQTACAPHCEELKARFDAFKNLIVDVKPNDLLRYIFTTKGVEVWVRDSKAGFVEGADFARAILASWIGTAPPNYTFKTALLGQ